MTDEQRITIDVGADRSRSFLPIMILAMALLLVSITLAEDAGAPIDPGDDASEFATIVIETPPVETPPAETAPSSGLAPIAARPTARAALRQAVPGFDETVHLWVEDETGPALLVWSNALAEPRRMQLPDGTEGFDLNEAGVKTLAVTTNANGRGVLWLGDRNRVEPAAIFDYPIQARWHEANPANLAVSVSAPDWTELVEYLVQPGNLLVETSRLQLEPGRSVDWFGSAGISMTSPSGQPVGVWVTRDGTATPYSRHLIQPGGRPIFDICTGVPCRPTVRMYIAPDGTFMTIPPEVVQVTDNELGQVALTTPGPEVRMVGATDAYPVPMSGVNGWSPDSMWMVFEQEGNIEDGMVVHPLGFLDATTGDLYSVSIGTLGRMRAIWIHP